jgi:hypothetical protein
MSKQDTVEISKYPSKKWETFITEGNRFSEIEIDKWKANHLIMFFCAKYKEYFGKDYQLKFNTPTPTKAYEVFRLNTCAHRLSSNPEILKNYIGWIFNQRVKIDKKSFRSISFLTNDENLSYYRSHILFAAMGAGVNIDRSTPLPPDIKIIVSSLGCTTFGDLAFIMKAGLDTEEMKTAKQKLEEAKFDFGVLDKIV